MTADQIASVARGAAVAAAGAALTYLTQWVSGQDFGVYTPLVAAGLAVLTNVVRKLAGG